jgi:ELWxxDGT repeat protein
MHLSPIWLRILVQARKDLVHHNSLLLAIHCSSLLTIGCMDVSRGKVMEPSPARCWLAKLWKSDGTPTGTVRVKDIYPGVAGSAAGNLFIAADKLYFSADDGIHGRKLWQSDGTPEGTFMVADICSGACSSLPTSLSLWNTLWQSTLFFQADDGVHGAELWALPLAEYEWHHYLPIVAKQR